MLPFLNVPLAAYNLFLLKKLNVQEAAANVHGQHKNILAKQLKKMARQMNISLNISYENTLLGSAGGLRKLQPFFMSTKEEDFYYLNGDSMIFLPNKTTLQKFYIAHKKSHALVSFLCCQPNTKQTVLHTNSTGRIRSFVHLSKTHKKKYHFCGLALISSRIFQKIPTQAKHLFYDVLETVCKKDIIRVHSIRGLKTLDMNQLSSYLDGTQQILSQLLSPSTHLSVLLHNILDTFSPGWRVFRQSNATIFCGRNVKGLSYLQAQHFAVLGDNCQITSNCCIERAVLNKNYCLNKDTSNDLLI